MAFFANKKYTTYFWIYILDSGGVDFLILMIGQDGAGLDVCKQ